MQYPEQLCSAAIAVVKRAASFVRGQSGRISAHNIEHKGTHDLVTYVDKTAEQMLVDGLSSLVPGAGFIAEENTAGKSGGRYNWIIDPLDGTTNFIHQVPCYAISVALAENGEVILGIVYEITRDECFYAWKDGPAFLNGKPIRVSATKKLDDALLATGFPYTDFSSVEKYIRVFRELMKGTRGLRRMGSAATDLCYVACGRFDGFFEYALKPWDVAAGAFIIRQAGGAVSDFRGGDDYIFGREIISGNLFITPALQLLFKEYFV
jgi:myo-inositol-1(or 4)-monophosphatase